VGPPLSVLVILQIADLKNAPPIKEYWVLLLLPLSFVLSHLAVDALQQCKGYQSCAELHDIMNIMGFMSGAISLLLIFSKHGVFKKLKSQKSGRERYWLILALMFLNALFLGAIFLNLNDQITASQTGLLKTMFGVAFAYLVSTILFRALPAAPKSQSVEANYAEAPLSDEEERVLKKVKSLLTREKIYQEAAYSRTDLAQECGVSESVISRVINVGFQKSFPQLMNEYRIEDAKNLLTETRAPIKVIAGEVGFNSLPSFNRAFKELTDISPTQYRKNLLKT
jgi:AraC-like DNA-binding protein